jgi:hypothetical protein
MASATVCWAVAAEAARGGLWVAMRRVKAVRVLARRTGCSLEAERMKEDMALAVCCGYVGEVVQATSLRSYRCYLTSMAGISWSYDALGDKSREACRGVEKSCRGAALF